MYNLNRVIVIIFNCTCTYAQDYTLVCVCVCVCVIKRILFILLLLWEPKMCRLAWQLLGMLGNVLGMLCNVLGMLCNVLGMLCNVLGVLGMPFRKVLGVPHRRKPPPPPTYCFIRCEAKGVVYHQTSIYETWWYTTPLAS